MQLIIDTINKASKEFMFGHVAINIEKVNRFQITDIEKISTFFELPPY